MKTFILNKKRLFILICFFALLSIVFIGYMVNKNNRVVPEGTPPPPVAGQASYKSIVPGTSTKEDVIKSMGKPLEDITGNSGTLKYSSLSPNRQNLVEIDNGKASFIKEIITLKDTKKTKEIVGQYGDAKKILYGPDAEAGFYLFVYPENGIAYIGHPESGLLLEVWYFPPTDLKNFISKYGQGYSETRQIRQ